MATLSLRNIKKIYPHASNGKKKKASKKGEAPTGEKANLEVTSQGVVAVQQFNLDIADKEFIVLGRSLRLRKIHHASDGRRSGGDLRRRAVH